LYSFDNHRFPNALFFFIPSKQIMADFTTSEEAAAKKASRSFKKYQYRGVELDQLLDLDNEKLIEVCYWIGWKGTWR